MFNVIGAGLAGSLVANELKKHGVEFRVFDNNELFASSKISENLFSETWLKDVSYVRSSLNFLFDNYEVQTKSFLTNAARQNVWHIPLNKILYTDYIKEKVTALNEEGLFCGQQFYKGINIVCAGYFCKTLIRMPQLSSLTGHGLLFEQNGHNEHLPEIMRHHRPYLHEKVFRWHDNRIWYGDSTTIVHENYMARQKQLIQDTLERAKKVGLTGKCQIGFGARPFMNTEKTRYGLFKRVSSNNYVLTAGWKDGLVIYPYLLKQLKEEIGL